MSERYSIVQLGDGCHIYDWVSAKPVHYGRFDTYQQAADWLRTALHQKRIPK